MEIEKYRYLQVISDFLWGSNTTLIVVSFFVRFNLWICFLCLLTGILSLYLQLKFNRIIEYGNRRYTRIKK